MKIKITNCSMSKDKIKMSLNIICGIDSFANSDYDKKSIMGGVFERIIQEIADEYLKNNKMQIINKIKPDEIINGCQIKIIESFSVRGQQ